MIFTFLLLYLFKFSNFVVVTSLSKTEVIQIAIFEYIILKDKLNSFGILGIIIATIGVILISIKDLKLFFKNFFKGNFYWIRNRPNIRFKCCLF